MIKYKIEGGGENHVTYGFDNLSGVYLSVKDRRLEWTRGQSNAVKKIVHSVGVGDGSGSYFDIHTGRKGYGTRVGMDTMADFLKRYGVSDERITELRALVPKPSPKKKS